MRMVRECVSDARFHVLAGLLFLIYIAGQPAPPPDFRPPSKLILCQGCRTPYYPERPHACSVVYDVARVGR